MSSLNILIVHNYYQNPGGEDSVVANEKRLLESCGNKVVLYTRDNSEISNCKAIKKALFAFQSIYNPKTFFEILKIIDKEKIDIIHVHNTLALISPSVYYAAVLKKIPVIQTIHNFRLICPGAYLYHHGEICEECIIGGFKCAVNHRCYHNSRLHTSINALGLRIHRLTGIYRKINYIFPTEFDKRKFLEANNRLSRPIFDTSSMYVKPHFTYNEMVDYDVSAEEKGYYLYLGRLDEMKGIEHLVKAFAEMPDAILFLGGSGGEIYKQYVKEHDLRNVHFLGQLNPRQVMAYLRHARALIFPSIWYETFGMTIIEAYSQGIPIICSDIGNGAELVKEKITGVHYHFNREDSLVSTIRAFEAENSDYSQETFREYREKYTPEVNYKLLYGIYIDVIKKNKH